MHYYVAIGIESNWRLVLGLGQTKQQAIEDARFWMAINNTVNLNLEVKKVSKQIAIRIQSGEIDCKGLDI